jgi:predicted metalloenzyme YecM
MIKTIEDFVTGIKPYVDKINVFAQKHSLLDAAKVDHFGYKCASKDSFESMREMFEQNSEFVYQSIISARRIAYIKLKKPISTKLGDILFIELQDQKPDGSQKEKYDHVEAYAMEIPYDEMVKKISELDTVVEIKRPHHSTHNVDLGDGFSFSCTHGPLLNKIKESEMI